MVLNEFLTFSVLYLKLVLADSGHVDNQPGCHLKKISCPCVERNGVTLNVTLEWCVDSLNEETKIDLCSGKAVLSKCRKAYFSQGRQRRNVGSQNLNCKNGTIIPSSSSPSIEAPPSVNINGHSQNVKADDNVLFKCTVVSNLAVNVTWLFNGVPLAEPMGIRHSYLECRTVLQIKNVLTKHEGNYTCVVQNKIGQATASSHLSVQQRVKVPYILYFGLENNRGSNVAITGSTFNLTCESQNVAVSHLLSKDGAKVQEGDGKHYLYYQISDQERYAKVTNLEIKNATFQDAGNYTCLAWLAGNTKQSTFQLRVVNTSQACRPGYYCPPGSQHPVACPRGTYLSHAGGLSRLDCRPCNPGYYCPLQGSGYPNGECSPGYHCPPGSTNPLPCPWGTYQPFAGAAECKQCENVTASMKPDYPVPAINITDCPQAYHPSHKSVVEKDEKPSVSSRITSVEVTGIVIGIIIAAAVTFLALYCIVKKKHWLSPYKTRSNITRPSDLESEPRELIVTHSEVNGSCGNPSDVQYLEVLKRAPEKDYEAKYDVFICYSYKDITWVKQLLAELEKRDFTCCIDFKDFLPGAAIVENISQAIYYSRKTVAVLTPDFVDSEWCNHELQKALTRIRSHQVVPIVYRNCAIPLILQDRTYLDWENCHVKPYFWDQLERALKLPNDGVMCSDTTDTTLPLIS